MLALEIICALLIGAMGGFWIARVRGQSDWARREGVLARSMRALQSRDYVRARAALHTFAPHDEEKETVNSFNRAALDQTLELAIDNLQAQDSETQTARRELEDVLASLQDAVLVVDGESRLRFLNASAQHFFDVQAADVLGAQLLEALPSFGLEAAVRDALQDGNHHTAELSLYAPKAASESSAHGWSDGGRREVLLRVAPVRRGDGVVSGAVAIVQDLTEMRRLERVRRDFVANASHELRTPIANIRAVAETALDAADDPAIVRRFLPQLVTEAERLSSLVSDLLDLARADSSAEMPSSTVDLGQIARDVARRLEDKARENQIAIRCDADASALVRGDGAALEQVAFNLVDNALMYTPAGGEITLQIGSDRHDEISPNGNGADPITLSVIDSGVGIPAADLPRIFERFYRVDKARSRSQGGTGLGLAIVKHIVEKHGGHVRVQSEIGNGTTFTITLPAA